MGSKFVLTIKFLLLMNLVTDWYTYAGQNKNNGGYNHCESRPIMKAMILKQPQYISIKDSRKEGTNCWAEIF